MAEKLPNIKSGSVYFFNYNHHGIAVGVSAAGAVVLDNTDPNNVAGWTGGDNRINYKNSFYFDASKTTGTGAGVYGDGNHVQPSCLTVIFWLRKA